MRKFKCSPFGEEVDLDNPKTYSYLPQTTRECDDLMFKEIGHYYAYTRYFHSDIDFKDQITRCEEMIKEFCENRRNNYDNLLWYQERIFLFQDETENMC